MRTHRPTTVFVTASIVLAHLVGCGSGEEAQKHKETAPEQKPATVNPFKETDRDGALKHFIQGSVYDAKGEYANAILEYQDALRLDPNAAVYYAISKDYSLLGKHDLAAQASKEAVRLDSTNFTYRENLAKIYLNAFQVDKAIREYEEMIRLDSNYVDAWYNLARLYQTSKPLRALEIYDRLLEREGDEWDLLYQSAEILNALGRFDQAATRYQRMLQLDPSNRMLQRQLAVTYGRAGKTDEAIRILTKMLEVNDTDLDVVSALADVYLDRREFEKAFGLYKKLLEGDKNNPELKLRVAIAMVGQVQRDSTFAGQAKNLFEEVKSAAPNDWRAYWYLGVLNSTEHNDSLAAVYFERVTQLAEWNADAWYYLGTTYFERKEYQKLLTAMESARKAVPKDHRFFFLSGLAYSQLEQPQEAIKMLEQACALSPDDINTLGTLALTYDGLHRFEESDRIYEQALRIDPKAHVILNNYSYSLAERSLQLDRALQMALQAIAAEPDNSAYLDTVGWIYFRLGMYNEAERYIKKSIEAGGASATVHEHLGDIYSKLGQKEKALESWRKALEMNSKNQALRDKISRGEL